MKTLPFLVFIAAFLTACSFPPLPAQEASPRGENPSSSSAVGEVPTGVALFGCPADQQKLYLKVSADLTLDTPAGEMRHRIDDGIVELNADSPVLDTIAIVSPPVTLAYTLEMNVGDCVLVASGPVSVSVSGVCQNGIVWLTITEDWDAYEGTITCEGASTQTAGPAMGPMTHAGADGEGEVFYMDRNFSDSAVGWLLEKEFAQGEGTHTWTLLYYPDFPNGLIP